MVKFISVMICFTSIVSCGANLSQKECSIINWYEKGLTDGNDGKDFRIIDDYKSICGEISIAPDENMYYAGYLKGITNFCTYKNGFQAGRHGGQAIGCPEGTDYLAGWKAGIKEFAEERERREIEKLTRPHNNEISNPGGGLGQTGAK